MPFKGVTKADAERDRRAKRRIRQAHGALAEHAVKKRAEMQAASILAPEQYIYIFESTSNGLLKIGTTKNVLRRLEAVALGHPSELRVYSAIGGTKLDMRVLERAFHVKYRHDVPHVMREWYKLDGQSAVEKLVCLASDMGISWVDSSQWPTRQLTSGQGYEMSRGAPSECSDFAARPALCKRSFGPKFISLFP